MIRYSKRIEKLIRESAFDKKRGIPGINLTPGLVEKAFTTRGNSRINCEGDARPKIKPLMETIVGVA